MIVLDNADVEQAVDAAVFGKFMPCERPKRQ